MFKSGPTADDDPCVGDEARPRDSFTLEVTSSPLVSCIRRICAQSYKLEWTAQYFVPVDLRVKLHTIPATRVRWASHLGAFSLHETVSSLGIIHSISHQNPAAYTSASGTSMITLT